MDAQSTHRVALVGAEDGGGSVGDRQLFGTPAEPLILACFSERETALLRLVCKRVLTATQACTFAPSASRRSNDAPPAGTRIADARRVALFRFCFPRAANMDAIADGMTDMDAIHMRGCRRVDLFAPSNGGNSAVSDTGLKLLASPALECLSVAGLTAVKGECLKAFVALRDLWLQDARSLHPTSCRFPSTLRRLGLHSCGSPTEPLSPSIFTGLDGLVELDLYQTLVAQRQGEAAPDLAALMPNLQKLSCRREQPQQVRPLLVHQPPPHMRVGGAGAMAAAAVAAAAAAAPVLPISWSGLQQLQELNLANISLAQPLSQLSVTLTKLELKGVTVTDRDLSHLHRLTDLRLERCNSVTGQCLASIESLARVHLINCTALTALGFGSRRLSSVHLDSLPMGDRSLGGVHSVTALAISKCSDVTEACLTAFPALTGLRIDGCPGFTGPGIAVYARFVRSLLSVSLTQPSPTAGLTTCVSTMKRLGFTVVESSRKTDPSGAKLYSMALLVRAEAAVEEVAAVRD